MSRVQSSLICGLLLAALPLAACSEDAADPTDSEALASDDGASPDDATDHEGEVRTAILDTQDGEIEVTYEVVDGLAMLEGDIILGPAAEFIDDEESGFRSAGRGMIGARWGSGIIPFVIDGTLNNLERQRVTDAITHWQTNTVYRFVPRVAQTDFINFTWGNGGCSSPVGRSGGGQNVHVGPCPVGTIIHEIGHSVGLWHEQSRADRGAHVIVNLANVIPGREFNFQTYVQQGWDGEDLYDYDINSIMHYGSYDFSANNLPTITRLDGSTFVANRTALTPTDIAGATRLLTRGLTATPIRGKNVGANGNQCLDVPGFSRLSQTMLQQFNCNGGPNQNFYRLPVVGAPVGDFMLVNAYSGLCVDVPGWSVADGVRLQQFPCHGHANQQFQRVTLVANPLEVAWKNRHSAKCMDVPGFRTDPGAPVNQFACNLGVNQRWF